MKTFIKPGDALELTTPGGGVTAGTPVQIGKLFVIPAVTGTLAALPRFNGYVSGVFSLPKTSAQAWAEGDRIYWDAGNSRADNTASVGQLIGIATAAAANPSATGEVKIMSPSMLAVEGVAAGYKVARGTSVITGTANVATGLASIAGFAITPLGTTATLVNNARVINAKAQATTPGTLAVQRYKHTAAGDCTLIAATVAGTVAWVAVGT